MEQIDSPKACTIPMSGQARPNETPLDRKDVSNRIMRKMLEAALKNVTGDRQGTYGLPLDNHTCTGEFWTTYLRRRGLLKPDAFVNARDVCNLNSLQKLSRDAFCPAADNQIDIAGYSANAEVCRIE